LTSLILFCSFLTSKSNWHNKKSKNRLSGFYFSLHNILFLDKHSVFFQPCCSTFHALGVTCFFRFMIFTQQVGHFILLTVNLTALSFIIVIYHFHPERYKQHYNPE